VLEDELPMVSHASAEHVPLSSYFIVQHLILLLQTRHKCVLREIIWAGLVLGVRALDLLVKGLYVGGQEAMKLERVALFFREGRAFVEVWSSKECIALTPVSAPCDSVEWWVLYSQAGFLRSGSGQRQMPELLVLLVLEIRGHVGDALVGDAAGVRGICSYLLGCWHCPT
jgi:hypothetical protein